MYQLPANFGFRSGSRQNDPPDNPAVEGELCPVGAHGIRHVPNPKDRAERVRGGAVDALGQVAGVLRVQDVGAAHRELGEADLVLNEDGEVARVLQDTAL